MAEINLTEQSRVDTTNDNIVIVNLIEDIPGGRALNVEGWPHPTIPAGHPVILDDDGEYKPIALNAEGNAIDQTDADKTIGVLFGTILTAQPAASIMVRGTVNQAAAVFAIPASCKAPISLIRFISE